MGIKNLFYIIIARIAEKLGFKSKKNPKTISPPKPGSNPLDNGRSPILPPSIVRSPCPEHKRIARSRLRDIKSIESMARDMAKESRRNRM
jgi:hypothetical protein